MKLENYEVHLPNYSIGDRIYDKIGPVCESYGKKVLIIGGRRALNAAEDKIRAYVAKTNLEIIGTKLYGTDCTYATVEKLREMPEFGSSCAKLRPPASCTRVLTRFWSRSASQAGRKSSTR